MTIFIKAWERLSQPTPHHSVLRLALFSTKRIIYWFISLLIVGFPPLECHLYWTESFVSTAAGTQSVVNNLLLNGKGNRSSHQCGSNEVHPV